MTHDSTRSSSVALREPIAPADRHAPAPGRPAPEPGGPTAGPAPRRAPAVPAPVKPAVLPPVEAAPAPWYEHAALLPALDFLLMALVLGPVCGTVAAALTAGLATVLTCAWVGLHRRTLVLSVLDDVPRLLGGVLVGAAAGLAVGGPAGPASRLVLPVLAAAGAVLAARAVLYPLVRRSRRQRPTCPTLIVGSSAIAGELGDTLLAHPEHGLRPVGYVDEVAVPESRALPLPLVGRLRDLAPLVDGHGIRCVVVAFGLARPADLVDLLRVVDRRRCRIYVVPRFWELHQVCPNTESIGGIPMVRLQPAAVHRRTWRVKRGIDLVVAVLGLVAAAPVLAVCALAVRLEGGPGVLFRQERVGLHDRRFVLLKLRTLRPVSDRESGTRWTVVGDPRMGRVGRVLRTFSLDELPQLVNVLRGDMSLVGPRPERPYFVEEFSRRYPGYGARHRVPVGLTGWAAVNGLRGDTSIAARARHDNGYIENWSLWLDVKVLIRTVGAVLARSGG